MGKVLIVGIDSLSPALLAKFGDELPNFSRLRRISPAVNLKSIFPPDSIPAWVTIYTGLNPAKHGLIYAQDVFGTQQRELLSFDSSRFRGKTFWDYAGEAGKKVCVLLPYVAYPSWPVNGLMVARARTETKVADAPRWISQTEIQTSPREAAKEHHIPDSMRTVFGNYPGRKMLGPYARDIWGTISRDADFALRICRECDWDLFFSYSYMLDTIQHFFWRYCDEADPRYPGPGPYQHVIKESYRLYDKVVGDFMQAHPDATIVVMSDHGHGMRPPRTVNVNAFLQTRGLLASKATKRNPALYLMGKSKSRLLDVVHKHELDYWLLNIASARALKPLSKKVYMSSSSIDMDRSAAFLSAFAGPKSYSHGGVEISRSNTGGMGYEELRSLVIRELSDMREPSTNEKLVAWICRREELYSGPYLSLYPDIVFELKEGYGVYWDVNTDLVGTAYEHNIAPGGHKKDAVFLISCPEGKTIARTDMTLMDVAPTVLDLLGVTGRGNLDADGSSIFGG